TAVPDVSEAGLAIDILNADNQKVGTTTFTPVDDAVAVSVTVYDLEPGKHGIHIHETGVCDPGAETPFSSAGGHFNPYNTPHGPGPQQAIATPGASPVASPAAVAEVPTESHAGDLGNITVADDGTATL